MCIHDFTNVNMLLYKKINNLSRLNTIQNNASNLKSLQYEIAHIFNITIELDRILCYIPNFATHYLKIKKITETVFFYESQQ